MWQILMHSAAILSEENQKLRGALEQRRVKQRQRRMYIAQGGALRAQQDQYLASIHGQAEEQVVQDERAQVR